MAIFYLCSLKTFSAIIRSYGNSSIFYDLFATPMLIESQINVLNLLRLAHSAEMNAARMCCYIYEALLMNKEMVINNTSNQRLADYSLVSRFSRNIFEQKYRTCAWVHMDIVHRTSFIHRNTVDQHAPHTAKECAETSIIYDVNKIEIYFRLGHYTEWN